MIQLSESASEFGLEYKIILPPSKRLKKKPCSNREQIMGIAMVSERDFDNVTYDWSCNIYAL